jgi:hypothetical protein
MTIVPERVHPVFVVTVHAKFAEDWLRMRRR